MDRVNVIEMAKKAGVERRHTPDHCAEFWCYEPNLYRFAALIKEAVIAEMVKDGWMSPEQWIICHCFSKDQQRLCRDRHRCTVNYGADLSGKDSA